MWPARGARRWRTASSPRRPPRSRTRSTSTAECRWRVARRAASVTPLSSAPTSCPTSRPSYATYAPASTNPSRSSRSVVCSASLSTAAKRKRGSCDVPPADVPDREAAAPCRAALAHAPKQRRDLLVAVVARLRGGEVFSACANRPAVRQHEAHPFQRTEVTRQRGAAPCPTRRTRARDPAIDRDARQQIGASAKAGCRSEPRSVILSARSTAWSAQRLAEWHEDATPGSRTSSSLSRRTSQPSACASARCIRRVTASRAARARPVSDAFGARRR